MRTTWKVGAWRGCRIPVRNKPSPPNSDETDMVREWTNEVIEETDEYFRRLAKASSGDISASTKKGLDRTLRWNDWCYVRLETKEAVTGGKFIITNRVTVDKPSGEAMNAPEVYEAGCAVAVAIAQVVVAKARLIEEKEPRCKGRVTWDKECPFFAEAVRRDDAWCADHQKQNEKKDENKDEKKEEA